MEYTEVMVRYGELSTKGKNRKDFINRLATNVERVLKDFPQIDTLDFPAIEPWIGNQQYSWHIRVKQRKNYLFSWVYLYLFNICVDHPGGGVIVRVAVGVLVFVGVRVGG